MIDFLLEYMKFGLWLVPSWLTAVAIHKLAPVSCPKGSASEFCREYHPFHLSLQNAGFCAFLGLFWPIAIGIVILRGYVKSVQVTERITVPQFKKVNTKNVLTAGDTEKLDQQFEEIKAETDERVNEILEGKVIPDWPRKK